MDTILDRFCRYVKIDTQAKEDAGTYPSTPGQWDLARLLVTELKQLGLKDVEIDDHCIVMATLPATPGAKNAPVTAWVAHVDTSPETSGRNVKPIVHRDYRGGDITLPGDPGKVIRVADNPDLKNLIGKTLVTSDGTTLLGADDKAGIAAIMAAVEHLLANPQLRHGPIRICFTCDEEIGHGVDHVDLKKLGAVVAYTLDGSGQGELDGETFSADLAIATVTGVNTHPSEGKGKMVNAVRILSQFIARMPWETLSPETTDGRDGFLHPYVIEGGVAKASCRILLRDFVTAKLADEAELLRGIAAKLQAEHPKAKIEVAVTKQYRNMGDGLAKEPRALAHAEKAMQRAGLSPKRTIIRGGTDGSRLTELGLPTPNLSTGEHNPHSPLEWTCVEQMQKAADVLVELAQVWAE